MMHRFQSSMIIPCPVSVVFPFFSDAANLQTITPPELRFQILTPSRVKMGEGARIDYRLQLYGIPFRWTTRIVCWDPPRLFVDQQEKGPYKEWVHTHRFQQHLKGTEMTDQVEYRLPFWPFGEITYPIVRREVYRIFRFRERTIRDIFQSFC